MKTVLLILAVLGHALAQTIPPSATGPTYFSTTGVRYSYYDRTLTETTNLGVRITSSDTPTVPQGLWAVMSVDASPRSQATSAAIRFGARYFISSVAGGNVIIHGNVQEGAAQVSTGIVSGVNTSAILNNLAGGVGFVWRVCHTFNPKSSVNCVADFNYELNAVSTQATKPVLGIYVGLTF